MLVCVREGSQLGPEGMRNCAHRAFNRSSHELQNGISYVL
jgi:hypothetical protein